MRNTQSVAVEQRRCQRTLYPDLRIIYNGLAETGVGRPSDLSHDGMFISTPHTFVPGMPLTIRFDLVCTGAIIEAVGQVRYCIPGLGVGVQFIDLPEPCRAAIDTELTWKERGWTADELRRKMANS